MSKNWQTYKKEVESSREHIVFPYFLNEMRPESGLLLAIGCGDGELADYLSEKLSLEIFGVDISTEDINSARATTSSDDLHFFQGDISENCISRIGIQFDGVYSNCCLNHLEDNSIYHLLMDLRSALADDGRFVCLVPSWNWAKKMYSNVNEVPSGVEALPRYGGVQFFRSPYWYKEQFRLCGYEVVSANEVLIPENDELDIRYRSNSGKPIFSAFVVKKLDVLPESKKYESAYKSAHENRKFEIELFWRRSIFYWGFIIAAATGFVATFDNKYSIIFSWFGFVCSIAWSAGNRGSKYWQQYWEDKVNKLQYYSVGNIFFDRNPKNIEKDSQFSPRRISVSKLTIALSDYVCFIWFLMASFVTLKAFVNMESNFILKGVIAIAIGTILYTLYFLRKCESED